MNINPLTKVSAMALAIALAAHAEPKLTGIHITSTDSAGKLQSVGAHHFKTFNHGGQPALFVVEGDKLDGAIVNGPTFAQTGINRSLPVGTHTFTIFAEKLNSYTWNTYALNLFFDNSNDPLISGLAPLNAQSREFFPPFLANPGPILGNGTKPSPGLVYKNGPTEVKLTAYHFSAPAVFGLDRVSPLEVKRNGAIDYVGSFTVVVTGPPEIFPGGSVNAASFANKVAPGSIFSVFGSGLAPGLHSGSTWLGLM